MTSRARISPRRSCGASTVVMKGKASLSSSARRTSRPRRDDERDVEHAGLESSSTATASHQQGRRHDIWKHARVACRRRAAWRRRAAEVLEVQDDTAWWGTSSSSTRASRALRVEDIAVASRRPDIKATSSAGERSGRHALVAAACTDGRDVDLRRSRVGAQAQRPEAGAVRRRGGRRGHVRPVSPTGQDGRRHAATSTKPARVFILSSSQFLANPMRRRARGGHGQFGG